MSVDINNHEAVLPPNYEKPNQSKLKSNLARFSMAMVCIMPVADLALSDALNVKALKVVDEKVQIKNDFAELGIENLIIGGFIFTEAMAMTYPITRIRKLQGSFNDYDEYVGKRRQEMGVLRKAASKAVSAPIDGLVYLGNKSQGIGERIASSDNSEVTKAFGRLVVDTGMVNAIGTVGVAMEETISSEAPVTKGRVARLSALITGSWLSTALVVKGLYRGSEELGTAGKPVKLVLDGIGRGFDTLTDIHSTTGVMSLAAVAGCLAVTGWNVAGYQQQKDSEAPNGSPEA